ncbi:MAG: adenylate/guanylate cyclase domain-containing protein [Candidatus Dactylopiibacterium sp.]|nr:adenylate/guanylate cyclase domain-containing protein [Candidatus Dactylopiibacterium sp.]
MDTFRRILSSLRELGIHPGDSAEHRMQKGLLTLLSLLFSVVAGAWLLVYRMVTDELPPLLPLAIELVILLNLLIHAGRGNVVLFRRILVATLLCFPFAARWLTGDFASASGLVLWGMLAPITALLCQARRESLVWFALYLVFVVLTEIGRLPATPEHISLSPSLLNLMFTLNFAALSTVIYLCLRFATHERARVQRMLEIAHAELGREQARSEQLLLNVLPAPIAERLKHSHAPIADAWPDVCVMFADIVGFTDLAAAHAPDDVFRLLNHVFSHFDELAERHGLEKIKTIGDAYMVAGGLHADAQDVCATMADLALEMRSWVHQDGLTRQHTLRIRVGIAYGPVVAGVVGRRKFIYDLWGDTVNLASRISSECPPDTIQCDARTFARLKYRYLFEDPVTLRLKGKGMVSVWRLLARNPLPVTEPPLDLDVSGTD